MTDRNLDILWILLALSLPLSALIVRREPLGTTIRQALIWLAIFVGGALIVGALARFLPHDLT